MPGPDSDRSDVADFREQSVNRIWHAGAYLALALWLGGCSTLAGDFHQKLQIEAVDAQNRPVEGMQCRVGSGESARIVTTPAHDVTVRRSALALTIECQRDALRATATVQPRRERMEEALLPLGSVGVFVDHLSGSLYSYPTALRLRVGQHVVLEHGGQAQEASADSIAPPAEAAGARTVEVAAPPPAVARAPVASATVITAPSSTGIASKTRSLPAAAKPPIKTTSVAAATPKPDPATAQKLALTAAAAAAAAPVVRSAPLNW